MTSCANTQSYTSTLCAQVGHSGPATMEARHRLDSIAAATVMWAIGCKLAFRNAPTTLLQAPTNGSLAQHRFDIIV